MKITNEHTKRIEQYMKKHPQFSGNILVAERDNIVFNQAYGFADRDQKMLNTTQTLFSAASAVTKPVTAVAILQLVEEGKLSLQDGIETYFPKYQGLGITIQHLLNHTSGIPNYLMLRKEMPWNGTYTVDDILTLVQQKQLSFRPGSKFAYNNTGFLMAAIMIENITGQSYAEYVQEHIFKPAGMSSTTVEVDGVALPQVVAKGYTNSKNTARICPALMYGCGNVITTASDAFAFLQALKQGILLQSKTVELMQKPSYTGKMVTIGMSWVLKNLFGKTSICHSGTHPSGYISHVEHYIEDDIAIIVFGNDMVKQARLSMKEFGAAWLSREIASIVYEQDLRFWQKVI